MLDRTAFALAAWWPLIVLWGSMLAFVVALWLLAAVIVDPYVGGPVADRDGSTCEAQQ